MEGGAPGWVALALLEEDDDCATVDKCAADERA